MYRILRKYFGFFLQNRMRLQWNKLVILKRTNEGLQVVFPSYLDSSNHGPGCARCAFCLFWPVIAIAHFQRNTESLSNQYAAKAKLLNNYNTEKLSHGRVSMAMLLHLRILLVSLSLVLYPATTMMQHAQDLVSHCAAEIKSFLVTRRKCCSHECAAYP